MLCEQDRLGGWDGQKGGHVVRAMPEQPKGPPGVAQPVEPILKEIDEHDASEERKRVGQVRQGRHTSHQGAAPDGVVADKREAGEEAVAHGSADGTDNRQAHIEHQREEHGEQEEGHDLSPR